ncbi:alkanesulfonate monooxygenase SsuD/methylene tetrahydromethanopterin reductase-like flavin-dependent oxidoreductase (luciferase family) [Streptomyces sp. 1114.5]|uniref:LLM class flavin-dependent oxidoreductase n=1 Tax=unclassified Streptomyces TaxID=2593676 RepID=UPI000BD04AE4|nr:MULTISPECIES: LLM class flavin-dependent oxidoreductase [unclassified Streptomyces]RKT17721.1 alkanesulfonate monooxygenase SsuD/methylene tetrahydromethanopterin reductase-like flavin-dependent oxidoreductase (luciferase family) [Streptomyces sp. 1114.5]SOB83925.1 Flavin-dependent oxidoreductase, luciferase family (includes alkanesulfonate monooxygenase SsuD and methylene tetrahydromethanopterin reductase) [Streptomyces sp. 1331.2]
MTDRPLKQIHLAAHFPGVNNTTVWSDPASGSHIEFASFRHLAQTAERGKFDFFFLAEGLRLRESKGLIHDLDVVGRPESITVLNALAAVTERLGLAATVNATFNEPYELARRFASLDHLSGGRAAWNVVTSSDAFTGENFRRGGYLDRADRYTRAAEFVQLAREFWDAGEEGVRHRGPQFDVEGRLSLPRPPQGHPVVIQAGDSDEGREFAAATADVVFSRHSTLADGQAFHADVKRRLTAYGRKPDELKIMPGVTFVLGDTDAEAAERATAIRRAQVGPQTTIAFLEQVWGIDLSGHDPDGPLPAVDPDPDSALVQGRVRHGDPVAVARRWRAVAAEKQLTSRELVIELTGRQSFIGAPATVAAQIDHFVQNDAADGFILVPHLTPGGLDEFVDRVVPLLQERGVFRTDYTGHTLRDHLGLPVPGRR